MTTAAILNDDTLEKTQTAGYTPLPHPELIDIIAHLNDEHMEELVEFLYALTPISETELGLLDVQLSDIYVEGIQLQVTPKSTALESEDQQNLKAQAQTFFIPFTAPITQPEDLQTQYILLMQKAGNKLGKKTIKLTQQRFTVEGSVRVSKNMLRLELILPKSSTADDTDAASQSNSNANPMPIHEPGYGYLFDLEHNALDSQASALIKTPRPHCYYTLRKAWHTDTGRHAWVDVFLHGDTSGGLWAESLQVGDTVVIKREVPEKLAHLSDGQALLIADETSIPTVARLLELWSNPTPPIVLCITQDAGDQAYFDEVKLNADIKGDFTLIPIVTNQVNAGADLATLIDNTLCDYLAKQAFTIDKIWGALEAGTAKALRKLLKTRLNLERSDMVVKVYWRHD